MMVCANFPNPVLTPYTTASGKTTHRRGWCDWNCDRKQIGVMPFYLFPLWWRSQSSLCLSWLTPLLQPSTGHSRGKNQNTDSIFVCRLVKVLSPPLFWRGPDPTWPGRLWLDCCHPGDKTGAEKEGWNHWNLLKLGKKMWKKKSPPDSPLWALCTGCDCFWHWLGVNLS